MSLNTSNPGNLLKEQREILQLTQEKVAAQLHFPIRIIRDLEENNYPNNSSLVFMKGYMRSYGRLLQIPEKKLLENFELFMKASREENTLQSDELADSGDASKTKPIEEMSFDLSIGTSKLFKHKKKYYLVIGLVMVAVILLFKNIFHQKSEPVNTEVIEHQQAMTITEPVIATTDEPHNG
jgi:cytoskeletal protein RodZ